MTSDIKILRRKTRVWLLLFMMGLLLSGLTAFPLKTEIDLLRNIVGEGSAAESWFPWLAKWISFVHRGVTETDQEFPFLFYGTDWLAFGHIVIAIAFIGPLIDPVKNIWIITFGMISCVLVIPLALICGPIRGIPFFWRLIDCSFGVFGIIPLFFARRYTKRLIKIGLPQRLEVL
jgi:hypothetical protein